jgi:diadenylate cyclase
MKSASATAAAQPEGPQGTSWVQVADAWWFYVDYINPLAQIAILTLLIYWCLIFIERVSAGSKLRGLVVLVITLVAASLAARHLEMHAIEWLLGHAISFSAIVLVIIFQPEARRLFSRVGGLMVSHNVEDGERVREQLLNAVDFMSAHRIGALIVIERSEKLDSYLATGALDAALTSKLVATIFWKDTPLHDGAMIVRGGRIAAAGVVLPLTENLRYKDLSGTRHRAAIGISEETDALALVVSEETGLVSVADRGQLLRGLARDDLALVLGRILLRNQRQPAPEGV